MFSKLRTLGRLFRGAIYCLLYKRKIKLFGLASGAKTISWQNLELGNKVSIGRNAWIEAVGSESSCNAIIIGDNSIINDDFHLACHGRVSLGQQVLIGSYVLISDHNHGIYSGNTQSSPHEPPVFRTLSKGEVNIGDRVWIGDKVSILGSVTLGSGVVVAANSVVTKSFGDNVIIGGNPARIIKAWDNSNSCWK